MILKENSGPPLNGLVLAGGKSIRMGQAKERIRWYGKEQRYYTADLLKEFCHDVFISCRPEQADRADAAYSILPDSFLNMGPAGGILSALRADRACAWLVVACDLPLLNTSTLRLLLDSRDSSKIATAFISPYDGLPEPLIAIWEPASYPVLLTFLGQGITCPRKALINSDIKQVPPLAAAPLMNVNTPQEAARARKLLNPPIS